MPADPFAVLGLGPDASADDVLAARRRLAKALHPDVGGDQRRMQEVNAAVEAALAIVATPPEPSGPERSASRPAPSASRADARRGRDDRGWRVAQDVPSFTIEALPAEAFEAIIVVTAWIGEALVDDPPYLLEAHLYEPFECWCRVELVPDAGASSVGLTVAVDDGSLPDVDAVRDVYVANLNRLDWGDLGHRPDGSPPLP